MNVNGRLRAVNGRFVDLPAFEQALYAVHAAVALAKAARGNVVSVRASDVLLYYYYGVVRRWMDRRVRRYREAMLPIELTTAKWWLQRLAALLGGVERPTKHFGYKVILPVRLLLQEEPVALATKLASLGP